MPSPASILFLVPAAIAVTLAGGALALAIRAWSPPRVLDVARTALLLAAVPLLMVPTVRAALPGGTPHLLRLLADHRAGWMLLLLPVPTLLLIQPLRGWGPFQNRSLRGMGVGPWLALRRVWLPLLAPFMLASVLACGGLLALMAAGPGLLHP